MERKKGKEKSADVHKDLKGFNISINSFGEMQSSMPIDRLNDFLNKKLKSNKDQDEEE